MKLAVNAWRVQGARTGVARYVINVVRHWTAEVSSAFSEITLYVPHAVDRDELGLPDHIQTRVLESNLSMVAWENTRLAASCRDDVVFHPSFSRPLWCRGRAVVTTHDAVQHVHPELFPRSVRLFYNRLYRWSARHAALVMTNTEAARQDVATYCGVPLDRIRTVYLAPAECFRLSQDVAAMDRVHQRVVGSDAPFFLFVGKISGRRYLPALIEAFALFKQRTALRHALVLVGLNPKQLDLTGLSARLGVAEHIRVAGYLPDDELSLLYNRADAFVMPSVYETSSLPIMEAQAAGAPVICIDNPGLREITGGAAAMIAQLDAEHLLDAMVRVAEDRAFRADVARRGLESSARFSWRRCSKETLDVLAEAGA